LERLQSIEWTKAALVAPIITAENSIEWLGKLESLSFRDLKRDVDRHRQSKVVCNLGPMAPSHEETGSQSPIRVASSDWRMEPPSPQEFWVTEENWEQLCYAVHFRVNALLLGDSGCGKSELARRIAKAADRRLEAFNFGAMSEARSSLIGNTHLNRNGTRFQKSRFVSTVESANSILLLDELSRAGRDAFNILFPLLDDQGYLALDESESAEVVQRAAGVAFLATANVGTQYTGTEALDLALLDRFPITITVDWPPADKEIAILKHRSPGLDPRDAARLVKIANEQRSRAREGEFVGMISTRSLIAAAKQIAAGISFERAFRYCILSKFSNEGGDTSERARLLQILQKNLK
jgi:nitric oxide reductase NorQ protein